MSIKLNIGDNCLCPRLGEEVFNIVSEKSETREYTLKSTVTGKQQTVYQTHCHAPIQMMADNIRTRHN